MAEGDIQQVSNSVADIALKQFKNAFAKFAGEKIGENENKFDEIANKLEGLLTRITGEEKIKKSELKQIYKIVFTLRQVLTNVQYSFQIGIDAVYNGEQRLIEYNINQNELFQNVNVNFRISKNGDLLLAKKLETQAEALKKLKTNKQDYFSDDPNTGKQSALSKHWDKLMNSISSIKEGKKEKEGNEGDLMYFTSSWDYTDKRGRTKSRSIRNYYYYRNKVWEYFNKGWVFEWGKALEAQLEAKEIKEEDLLSFILQQSHRDTLRGYLYGDYYQEAGEGFEAIQAKRGNARIMTFNDLKQTLQKLSDLFRSLSKNIGNTKKIAEVIKGYFNVDDGKEKLEQKIRDFIDDSIDQTVENLQDMFDIQT